MKMVKTKLWNFIKTGAWVLGVSLIVTLTVGICVKSNEVDRAQADNNRYFRQLKKQPYITVSQFDDLFNSAQESYDNDLLSKMNNTKVVDDDNGFVYHTELEHHKTKPYYSYKFVQVMDGKKAYINPSWSKKHK